MRIGHDADLGLRRGILTSDMSASFPRKCPGRCVALACIAIVLLSSCHGSDKHAATKGTARSTNTRGQPNVSLALLLGSLTVQAAGTATPFSPALASSIRDLINEYIAAGITRPLFTGASVSGMSTLFAPSLASRVGPSGPDFAALSDQGVPVMTAVTATAKAPLALVGLEDHGQFVMVGGEFLLTVRGTTAQGPLTVSRTGNFVLEPVHHQWRITGYDIVVNRADGQTSTSQRATTTTAAP